jgi:hypothetical protein
MIMGCKKNHTPFEATNGSLFASLQEREMGINEEVSL